MQLNELFDSTYNYHWDMTGDQGSTASFRTEDDSFVEVTIDNLGVIAFARNDRMDTTYQGDAFKIMSTVVAIVKDWWVNIYSNMHPAERPRELVFSAEKEFKDHENRGRSTLYKRLGKALAAITGWQYSYSEESDGVYIKLRKPRPRRNAE